ncbi:N-acetylmannosamine kinase [Anaerocolumna cellulosilytica]|uniref:N-acetylmannosamine kinase n=1 Tax=Anaerocolumna cellulosilytica TaxID=433286 RepID=A0A6S6R3Z4_9FIRM|nr:MurR/RpiR family transcriptional regulator [Anaerocolumna cellulosilytica]MBB5194019.1 DNA-binding MurR/RpiR family transcriptional regulator [Anaerocolumna cellulosilytica]BCJ94767.1 N-acetylmannosamine kinase [Anaerocolumna cellulosilytica]
MSGILQTIEENYNQFTKSEKKVADYIFKNSQSVLYTSITDLAELCGVGDTTVFRFCKDLKLNGYQEFKMLLAQDVTVSNTKDGGLRAVTGMIEPGDTVETLCKKALAANITALEETFHGLDYEAISKSVDMLSAAKRIHFFGVGSSGVTALEAKQKFMRIMPNVDYVADGHMQHMAAALLDSRDLAVIFSYSGSTKDMIEVHNLLKKNGCKSICITRHAKSVLTAQADIVLSCGSNEGPLDGGAASTSIVQLYLLDVLYLQYFIRHYNLAWDNKSRTTEAIAAKLL